MRYIAIQFSKLIAFVYAAAVKMYGWTTTITGRVPRPNGDTIEMVAVKR